MIKISPAEAKQSTGTEAAPRHCCRRQLWWDLNHLSSTIGKPSVMNEAEEAKQPPVRHLQLPGQNPRHSEPAAREGAGWVHVILLIRAKKPSPRAAPALMPALNYVQTAPCDGAWCATGLQIHQLLLSRSCFSSVAGRDASIAMGGESQGLAGQTTHL